MAGMTESRGTRKVRKGVVVSRSGDKSIVVQTERRLRHPLFGKVVRQFKKFHAHDEGNAAKVGERVGDPECRPMSKRKRWGLVDETTADGAEQG